ncbi:MAG: YjjG family noncanonical pyrimidine nucleotidase [Acidimicrobiia bacterium]|nr:YjjG family noncanonical pyrimidine nucleotidase [Acidimicrobiia bacterium]
MPYTAVLFDLDHTLLDSRTSEVRAFDATLRESGIEDPQKYYQAYSRINQDLWTAVESGRITPNDLRVTRWERLVASFKMDADVQTLAQRYVQGLGEEGDLYPGTLEVLNELSEFAALALVTNGLAEVQRTRITRLGLARYFDPIVISGEVGVSKPAAEIFELTFRALDTPVKAQTLMVGDSLTSDIQGGINFGIDTCWYNPHSETSHGPQSTHEIADLSELVDVVSNGNGGAW